MRKEIGRCRFVELAAVGALFAAAAAAPAAWQPGTNFRIEQVNGRAGLVAPDGRPFKSVGVVWAYGPERGPLSGDLTAEKVIEHLKLIKALGFNTLNLYGDRFIPEMLAWCDENELAVYFRTSYYSLPDFPSDLKQYPDFMDPDFRKKAQDHYRDFLAQIKGHPSVLAMDMDHRWLFQLDWSGGRRFDVPHIRPCGVRHFPKWLGERYGRVEQLNAARGTAYPTFDAVLEDQRLLTNGVFHSLTNHPLRADVVRYTLWTAEDFLEELAGAIHAEVPVIVTPTTEHPEAIPECNPRIETGIGFMSPVHYNGKEDFGRDMPGLCKLAYETRWHYDLQGGPAYISETGWRTATLNQDPPNRDYAWIDPPDEELAARAYALQFALLNVLPWVSGYGYFKLYDKPPEGDFGYLRDDRAMKPMALVGDAINGAFDTAGLPDPEPQAWIYHPDYAHASYRPGFQQLKTWVAVWEKPFLDALGRRVDEHWIGLRSGDRDAGRRFAADVTADFTNLWRGFAFARTLPADDKPVILLSTISALLSPQDRVALAARKTIAFGEVGIVDDSMRGTMPWSLESLGLRPDDVRESYSLLDLSTGGSTPLPLPDNWTRQTNASPWRLVEGLDDLPETVCTGQVVRTPPGRYGRMELLAGAENGDASPFCEAEYSDGTRQRLAWAPTVSDMRFHPFMTDHVQRQGKYLSRIAIPLDAEKELQAIRLPKAPWVRLFGVILARGGAARDVYVSLAGPDGARRGKTTWRLHLPVDERGEPVQPGLAVLQRSAQGEPLVVARDGHVAVLYDMLTWAGKPDEVSRFTDLHAVTLDQCFGYLKGTAAHE